MTFKELCNAQQASARKDVEAARREAEKKQQTFIRQIAQATSRSEATVTFWVKYGRRPLPRAQQAIARLLRRPVEELFPENEH